MKPILLALLLALPVAEVVAQVAPPDIDENPNGTVPVSGTLALFGIGAAVLLVRRRSRK